jgi:hypothetical protein
LARSQYLDKTVFPNTATKNLGLKKINILLPSGEKQAKIASLSNTSMAIRESFVCIIFLQFLKGTL